MARGPRSRVESAPEAELVRFERDDGRPVLGGDQQRAITRAAVDGDDLDIACPPLGGQDLQTACEVRLLVARADDELMP
jgi:hypothetical protein